MQIFKQVMALCCEQFAASIPSGCNVQSIPQGYFSDMFVLDENMAKHPKKCSLLHSSRNTQINTCCASTYDVGVLNLVNLVN